MFTIRPLKRCPKCGETKPATREFWKMSSRRFQLCHGYCKACTRSRRSLAERFWIHVDKNGPTPEHRPELGPCWIWTATRNNMGYGCISVNNRNCYAHRVAWLLEHGAIPSDIQVLHACDGGSLGCVNHQHLFLGTQADNLRDMAIKGRSGTAKLSANDVSIIRMELSRGVRGRSIAKRFGVSEHCISKIKSHKNWRHVG